MSHPSRLSLGILILLLCFNVRSTAATQDDRTNAAYWYSRAIEALERDLSPDAYRTLQAYLSDPASVPAQQVNEVLDASPRLIAYVRRGGYKEYSDFGLEHTAIPGGTKLTHLAPLSKIALVLHADAQRELTRGNGDLAARRLASVFDLAKQITFDRFGWSSHTANFILSEASDGLDAVIGAGIEPAQAAVVLQRVRNLDSHDPTGALESYLVEQERLASWVSSLLNDDLARGEAEALFDQLAEVQPEYAAAGKELMQLSSDDLAAEYDQLQSLHNEIAQIAQIDDETMVAERVREVTENIKQGEYGDLARTFETLTQAPSLEQRFEQLMDTREMLDEKREILEQIVRAELDPTVLAEMNAAVWYKRAADELAKLTKEQLADLRQSWEPKQLGRGTATNDHMQQTTARVIELLSEGSKRHYCDFASVSPERSILLPSYVVSIHDCQRVLARNIMHLLKSRCLQDASDQVAASIRVAVHLGGDGRILSSMTAQEDFRRGLDLARRILHVERQGNDRVAPEEGRFDEEQARDQFVAAISDMNMVDPFGHALASEQLRSHVKRRWYALLSSAQHLMDNGVRVEQFIGDSDSDQLWCLAIVLGSSSLNDEESLTAAALRRVADLRDLVSAGFFEQPAEVADILLQLMQEADLEALLAWPVGSTIKENQHAARRTFEDARQLLKGDLGHRDRVN